MGFVFTFCFGIFVIAQAIPLRTGGELRVDGALGGEKEYWLVGVSFNCRG